MGNPAPGCGTRQLYKGAVMTPVCRPGTRRAAPPRGRVVGADAADLARPRPEARPCPVGDAETTIPLSRADQPGGVAEEESADRGSPISCRLRQAAVFLRHPNNRRIVRVGGGAGVVSPSAG
jgi:hypothetical protein